MKKLTDLEEDELIFYSKLIVSISTMLSTDRDFARRFIMQPNTEYKVLEFFAEVWIGMDLNLCFVSFNRDNEIFSSGEINFPKGLFDDLIHYV